MLEDYYSLLNVPRDAGAADIKRAFRRLAKIHHPDKSNDPGAEERFHQIQTAYSILSDEYSRMIYDQFLGNKKVNAEHETPHQEYGQTYATREPARHFGWKDFISLFAVSPRLAMMITTSLLGVHLYQAYSAEHYVEEVWLSTVAHYQGGPDQRKPKFGDSHIPYTYRVNGMTYWYANSERQTKPEILIYYNKENPFEAALRPKRNIDPWVFFNFTQKLLLVALPALWLLTLLHRNRNKT